MMLAKEGQLKVNKMGTWLVRMLLVIPGILGLSMALVPPWPQVIIIAGGAPYEPFNHSHTRIGIPSCSKYHLRR